MNEAEIVDSLVREIESLKQIVGALPTYSNQPFENKDCLSLLLDAQQLIKQATSKLDSVKSKLYKPKKSPLTTT